MFWAQADCVDEKERMLLFWFVSFGDGGACSLNWNVIALHDASMIYLGGGSCANDRPSLVQPAELE